MAHRLHVDSCSFALVLCIVLLGPACGDEPRSSKHAKKRLVGPPDSAKSTPQPVRPTTMRARPAMRRVSARPVPNALWNVTPADLKRARALQNASIKGALDAAIVRRAIRRHMGEVIKCYRAERVRKPDLVGTVQATFTIATAGHVSAVSTISTLLGKTTTGCIVDALRKWRFPSVKRGTTNVVYPFLFHCKCSDKRLHDAIVLKWLVSGRKGRPPAVPAHHH